jgi:hypothetical protein
MSGVAKLHDSPSRRGPAWLRIPPHKLPVDEYAWWGSFYDAICDFGPVWDL